MMAGVGKMAMGSECQNIVFSSLRYFWIFGVFVEILTLSVTHSAFAVSKGSLSQCATAFALANALTVLWLHPMIPERKDMDDIAAL